MLYINCKGDTSFSFHLIDCNVKLWTMIFCIINNIPFDVEQLKRENSKLILKNEMDEDKHICNKSTFLI